MEDWHAVIARSTVCKRPNGADPELSLYPTLRPDARASDPNSAPDGACVLRNGPGDPAMPRHHGRAQRLASGRGSDRRYQNDAAIGHLRRKGDKVKHLAYHDKAGPRCHGSRASEAFARGAPLRCAARNSTGVAWQIFQPVGTLRCWPNPGCDLLAETRQVFHGKAALARGQSSGCRP